MKNISKVLYIIAFVIFSIVFLNKDYNANRLTLAVLAIIILIIAYVSKRKRNFKNILLYILICITSIYVLDMVSVYFLKSKPIFSYKIKSSKNFITYNSLLYREFECNNKTYLDFFYKKATYCDFSLLEEKDINTLASDIVNNYNEYRDKFYIINAKISHKEGNDLIELKSYDMTDTNIDGGVTFSDNITFECSLKSGTDNLKLYDNIKIVARISKLKKEKENYRVSLKDCSIYNLKDYKNYKINIVENKSCQKDKTEYVSISGIKYYTSCLSNIYAVFEDDDVYDLNYVLKDEKITLKQLLENYEEKEEKTEDNQLRVLYKFENYNILMCDNNNIIIGNKKLTFTNNYCNVKDQDNNDL